jgi:hypothetical protein
LNIAIAVTVSFWGTAGFPVYNHHGEFVMKAFELKK